MEMRRSDPSQIKTRDLHQYLLGSVAPRPIAFVSTMDAAGRPNLAPYSFFNCFSSNPPILVFSSNRRVVDNTTKDTLSNIKETKEAVINVVNHAIVRQMAVASIQFPTGISEFDKTGLTPIASDVVSAPRVKESPAQMECKVKEIITLGEHGGAGHLIICEVVMMHISEQVIENDRINPHKMDLMGRMGRAYYVRASGDAVQTIIQAVTEISIGFDALPESIQKSNILTGNDIGIFAGMKGIPSKEELMEIVWSDNNLSADMSIEEAHQYAQEMIQKGEHEYAFKVALLADFEN